MTTRAEKLATIMVNIKEAEHILLFTHRDPDADAWGSTQAVRELLVFAGKTPHCIYNFKDKVPSQAMRADPGISIYGPGLRSSRTEIDLAQYDYALCLDTSYSDHNITGFKFTSQPRLGVGTIDHHSRSDKAFEPKQDYNLPDACATCEIVYDLVPMLLKLNTGPEAPATLGQLPLLIRKKIASRLLPGVLDDIVGLTIPEKINHSNLAMLSDLKSIVGHRAFRRILTRSRTLSLIGSITPYAKYLKHKGANDADGNRYHIYLMSLPERFATKLRDNYASVITILEHYARNMCLKKSWRYGMFMMTIEKFDAAYSKFSARGPLIKDVFQGVRAHDHLFLSYGISGNSAMGGKIANDRMKAFPAGFMKSLKRELKTKHIKKYELDHILEARLQSLIEQPAA